MIMKNYVADELMNKVYHLTQALNKAKDIVSVLEEENKNLRDAFNNLASLNNEDYTVSSEGFSEQTYSV